MATRAASPAVPDTPSAPTWMQALERPPSANALPLPRKVTRTVTRPCSTSRSSYLTELDRSVLAPRRAGGLGDTQRLERVARCAEVLRLPAREAQEVSELGLVRVREAHEEGRIRRSGERRRIGLDGAPWRAWIDADRERLLRGVDRSEEHTSELQSRGHLVC